MDAAKANEVSKIITTLKEIVKCPICLDCIQNCSQLQCGHEFCKECIDKYQQSKTTNVCPMCNKIFKKRQKPSQNWFVNDLSSFINTVSDLLTSTHETDGILMQARPSTPKDQGFIPVTDDIENKENAFDKLLGDTKRCYVNKRKLKSVAQPTLYFQDSNIRNNVIHWLNDANEKLDIFSQKSQHLELENIQDMNALDLPDALHRVRSQSLNVNDKVKEPLLKRYHSLTENLDDYTIDEINTEQIIQQVERKVVQDMLEDECLNNFDLMQDPVSKPDFAEKNSKKPEVKKTSPTSSHTGWERINIVKKTIKKAAKVPKKLNISLQSQGKADTPRKSKRKRGKSNENINQIKKMKETKDNGAINNSEISIDRASKDIEQESSSAPKENKNFNLSTVEKYFLQNMNNLESNVSKSPDVDSPQRISKKNSRKGSLKHMEQEAMAVIQPINDKLDEVDIFLMPTQKSNPPKDKELRPEHSEYDELFHSKFECVPKASDNHTSIDTILKLLHDSLERCVQRTLDMDNPIPNSLLDCFLNLKSYVEKVQQIRTCKEDRGTQVVKKVNHVEVQTKKIHLCHQQVQTLQHLHSLVDKNLQTSQTSTEGKAQLIEDMEIDYEINPSQKSQKVLISNTSSAIAASQKSHHQSQPEFISKKTHLDNHVSNSFIEKMNVDDQSTKICEDAPPNHIPNKISRKITFGSSSHSQNSQNDLISKKTHLDTPILNSIIEQINIDNQSTKICEDINGKSQGSVLILTAPPTNLPNRTSRKLPFGNSSSPQKKFKRIKTVTSDDSDSDETADEKEKGSKQFLRDDLTIKFVDTESNDMENEKTPDNFDYDEYLEEVMQKYGNSPKKKPVEIINSKKDAKKKTTFHTSQAAGPSNINTTKNNQKSQISDNKTKSEKGTDCFASANIKKRKFGLKSQSKTDLDEFEDHIFTADIAFQENLEKFDQEIAEHCNTESNDIVENTPTNKLDALESKMTSSNKDKNSKKMKEPPKIQILSKNKVASEENKKSHTPDEIKEMLEDIKNNASFFRTEIESQMPPNKGNGQLSESLFKNTVTSEKKKPIEHSETCYESIEPSEKEKMNEKDIFEDDLDEAELAKISFTTEQKNLDEITRSNVDVLQNIKVKTQDRGRDNIKNGQLENYEIDDSGEEDFIDKTPEKKNKSNDRSFAAMNNKQPVSALEFIDNHFDDDICLPPLIDDHFEDDICLPPPPGFGDDFDTKTPEKKTVTQVGLSEMIVTPETCISPSNNKQPVQESTEPFNLSLVMTKTPKVTSRLNHSTPRSQFGQLESLHFSPIIENTETEKSQTIINPIVSKLTTKKTTPLMTSSPNQKSILNYIRPSQEVSPMPQKPKACITTSRLIDKDMSCFTQLEAKRLISVKNSWDSNVTHLVVLVDSKGRLVSHTAKYLLALAHGAWVVRYEWVQDCARQEKIVPEEPYEALDLSGTPGPKMARLNREKNPLFKDYRFFCAPPFQIIPRSDLEVVLKMLGGEIVNSVNDINQNNDRFGLVVTDTSDDMNLFEDVLEKHRVVTVDIEWITKCVGQYKLTSVRPYLLCSDETVHDLGYPTELVESVPFTFTEGPTLGQQ